MKLLNVNQIRDWDEQTILREPISSIDLMERAGLKCFNRIKEQYAFSSFAVFCGPGNNGGDGLVIARLLKEVGLNVSVFIPQISTNFSSDFTKNMEKLNQNDFQIFESLDVLADLDRFDCIIDAVFGSGLSKPINGFLVDLFCLINKSKPFKISIDIPSGVFGDLFSKEEESIFVKADKVYSLQVPKTSFFNSDIRRSLKDIEVLDINLDSDFIKEIKTDLNAISLNDIHLKPLHLFSHKFERGWGVIVGGSKGKYGAPILSSKSCLRTGAGLVSLAIPNEGRVIAHQSFHELMLLDAEGDEFLNSIDVPAKTNSVGIGPGLGINSNTKDVLEELFTSGKSLVIDADAISLLAHFPDLMNKVPENTILTPHIGEFDRLFGNSVNQKQRLLKLKDRAKLHRIVIVLKGAITTIALPSGEFYFSDEVGNPGMATAGSGDVLMGIVTSLLAQGYSEKEAAINGVYIHGLAGDLAAKKESHYSLMASDIISSIGEAIENLTEKSARFFQND